MSGYGVDKEERERGRAGNSPKAGADGEWFFLFSSRAKTLPQMPWFASLRTGFWLDQHICYYCPSNNVSLFICCILVNMLSVTIIPYRAL